MFYRPSSLENDIVSVYLCINESIDAYIVPCYYISEYEISLCHAAVPRDIIFYGRGVDSVCPIVLTLSTIEPYWCNEALQHICFVLLV